MKEQWMGVVNDPEIDWEVRRLVAIWGPLVADGALLEDIPTPDFTDDAARHAWDILKTCCDLPSQSLP